jgi:hypothetical protein
MVKQTPLMAMLSPIMMIKKVHLRVSEQGELRREEATCDRAASRTLLGSCEVIGLGNSHINLVGVSIKCSLTNLLNQSSENHCFLTFSLLLSVGEIGVLASLSLAKREPMSNQWKRSGEEGETRFGKKTRAKIPPLIASFTFISRSTVKIGIVFDKMTPKM